MKLTFDCIHCLKENEIRIQSTIFKDCSSQKEFFILFYNHESKKWETSCYKYKSLEDFKKNSSYSAISNEKLLIDP